MKSLDGLVHVYNKINIYKKQKVKQLFFLKIIEQLGSLHNRITLRRQSRHVEGEVVSKD